MDINLDSLGTNIVHILKRYHVIIYALCVIGALGAAVLALNSTVESSADSNGYQSTLNSSTFDQATIDRINELSSSGSADAPIDLGNGRINPFNEK